MGIVKRKRSSAHLDNVIALGTAFSAFASFVYLGYEVVAENGASKFQILIRMLAVLFVMMIEALLQSDLLRNCVRMAIRRVYCYREYREVLGDNYSEAVERFNKQHVKDKADTCTLTVVEKAAVVVTVIFWIAAELVIWLMVMKMLGEEAGVTWRYIFVSGEVTRLYFVLAHGLSRYWVVTNYEAFNALRVGVEQVENKQARRELVEDLNRLGADMDTVYDRRRLKKLNVGVRLEDLKQRVKKYIS